MDIKTYENEIERTYKVLSAEKAEDQNYIDIKAWETENRIDHKEAHILRIINHRLYYENRFVEE